MPGGVSVLDPKGSASMGESHLLVKVCTEGVSPCKVVPTLLRQDTFTPFWLSKEKDRVDSSHIAEAESL